MPKVTVIIPVYNVRDHLENCIRSVQAQTLADWELILVNDGSTDGSDAICRTFAGADPRIRVIDQANAGVSAARNAGLDAAAGEYVTFLDGDDAYDEDHLRTLLSLAEETGADSTAVGILYVNASDNTTREVVPDPGMVSGTDNILLHFMRGSHGLYSSCNKLFSRTVIGDIRLRPYAYAEDALFCAEVLSRCRIFAASDMATYRYIKRSDSATENRLDRRFTDQFKAWAEIYDLLEREAPGLCSFAAEKICHDVDRCYMPCREKKSGEWKRLCGEMKTMRLWFSPRRFPEGKMPARKLAAELIYRLSPVLYYKLAQR